MKKQLLTIGAAAGALAAGTTLAYKKIMKFFFNLALERETKYFKSKGEESGKYQEVVLAGEVKMESIPWEHVYTTSFDGLKLHGRYYRQEGAERTFVLVPGWRGGWNYEFCLGGPWLYEEGCNLLVIDQRAQGDSEGEIMTMGLCERKDCHSWLKWLEENTDATTVPVYFMGISMGATTVLMAAGDALPSYVKGIIADCGYTTPYDMLFHYGHRVYHIPEVPLMKMFNQYCKKHAGIDLKAYSTLDAMETATVPIFFVHGKEDKFVPMEMTIEAYNAYNGPKRLFLVEDAPHGMSFLFDTEGYIAGAHAFFAECEAE